MEELLAILYNKTLWHYNVDGNEPNEAINGYLPDCGRMEWVLSKLSDYVSNVWILPFHQSWIRFKSAESLGRWNTNMKRSRYRRLRQWFIFCGDSSSSPWFSASSSKGSARPVKSERESIHPKCGCPWCPDSAENKNIPQRDCLRMRKHSVSVWKLTILQCVTNKCQNCVEEPC